MTIAICFAFVISFAVGVTWGGCLERDRRERFPTGIDRMPSAKVLRQWQDERLDIRAAMNRRR